jgi:hypothetical protein
MLQGNYVFTGAENKSEKVKKNMGKRNNHRENIKKQNNHMENI